VSLEILGLLLFTPKIWKMNPSYVIIMHDDEHHAITQLQ
jgi:hypothetical protein